MFNKDMKDIKKEKLAKKTKLYLAMDLYWTYSKHVFN